MVRVLFTDMRIVDYLAAVSARAIGMPYGKAWLLRDIEGILLAELPADMVTVCEALAGEGVP